MYSSIGPIQLLVGILVVQSLTCLLRLIRSIIYSFKCDVHLLEHPFPGSSGWSVVLTVVQDASYIIKVNVIKIKMMLPRICIYIYKLYEIINVSNAETCCHTHIQCAKHTSLHGNTCTCLPSSSCNRMYRM